MNSYSVGDAPCTVVCKTVSHRRDFGVIDGIPGVDCSMGDEACWLYVNAIGLWYRSKNSDSRVGLIYTNNRLYSTEVITTPLLCRFLRSYRCLLRWYVGTCRYSSSHGHLAAIAPRADSPVVRSFNSLR